MNCDHPTNPFATRFVRPGSIGYCFGDLESCPHTIDPLASLVDRISQTRFASIVGPHGTGKSTLVQSLLPRLGASFQVLETIQLHSPMRRGRLARFGQQRTNWKRFSEVLRRQPSGDDSDPSTLLVVDGFEQLSNAAQKQTMRIARRRGHALLITTHCQMDSFATVHRTQVNADILQRLTNDLVADSEPSIRKVVQREMTSRNLAEIENVRDFWFELYDLVADQRQ